MQILKDALYEWFISLNLGENLAKLLETAVSVIFWILLGLLFSRISKSVIKKLKAKERNQVKRKKTILL